MAESGYFQRPGFVTPVAKPGFQAPTLPTFTPSTPTGPVAERGLRPTSQVQEKSYLTRMSSLPAKYQPARTAQIGQTKAALAGYGGYEVGDDGSIKQSGGAGMRPGELYKQEFRNNLDAANARGIIDSSFAAKAVGAAFGRLSAEAQGIVTQHAAAMNQLVAQEASEFDELNTGLMQLYGDEAQYLLDNPPAPPPDPAPAAAAGKPNVWTGSIKPNKKSLSKAWGIPENQIKVTPLGGGKFKAEPK